MCLDSLVASQLWNHGWVLWFFSDFVHVPSLGARAGPIDSLKILFMCQVWSQGWVLRFFSDFAAVPSVESGLGTWNPKKSKVMTFYFVGKMRLKNQTLIMLYSVHKQVSWISEPLLLKIWPWGLIFQRLIFSQCGGPWAWIFCGGS